MLRRGSLFPTRDKNLNAGLKRGQNKRTRARERAAFQQRFPFPAGCLHWRTESQHIRSLSSELAFRSCFSFSLCSVFSSCLSFSSPSTFSLTSFQNVIFFFLLPRILLQTSQAWCRSVSVIHTYSTLHLPPTLPLSASVTRAQSCRHLQTA